MRFGPTGKALVTVDVGTGDASPRSICQRQETPRRHRRCTTIGSASPPRPTRWRWSSARGSACGSAVGNRIHRRAIRRVAPRRITATGPIHEAIVQPSVFKD
jgi:hypothetical protein